MRETDNTFPLSHGNCYDTGLEARDYIAIQAMVGILANSELSLPNEECVAEMAYKQADAMIKQSEVPHE